MCVINEGNFASMDTNHYLVFWQKGSDDFLGILNNVKPELTKPRFIGWRGIGQYHTGVTVPLTQKQSDDLNLATVLWDATPPSHAKLDAHFYGVHGTGSLFSAVVPSRAGSSVAPCVATREVRGSLEAAATHRNALVRSWSPSLPRCTVSF